MSYRAAIGLGSNLGDRVAHLRAAVEELARLGAVVGVSSLFESAPRGGPEQPPYANAVVVLLTDLEPEDLLTELAAIEASRHRERGERWGPRTLDLDLLTVVTSDGSTRQHHTERLVLPHPRAGERRFVLEPLAELWPQAPVGAEATAAVALAAVADQEVERLGRSWTSPSTVAPRLLVAVQVLVFAGYATAVLLGGRGGASSPWLTAGGVVVAVAGAVLAFRSAFALGPALSPLPAPRPGTALVVSGPYRFVRHPIYSGLILVTAGVAMIVASPWALLATLVVATFLWLKAVYEESRCRIGVPGYARYQRRVRGRLIPVPLDPC